MEEKSNRGAPLLKHALSLIIMMLLMLSSCSEKARYPAPSRSGDDVVINAQVLKPGVPQFFTFRHHGKNINFFVINSNGKVLSFLDACMTCYRSRLGYRFSEGYFTCKDCNKAYSVTEIEKGFGGCYPIRIPGHLKDGHYRISMRVFEKTGRFF